MSVLVRNPEYTCDICDKKAVSGYSNSRPNGWDEFHLRVTFSRGDFRDLENYHVCLECSPMPNSVQNDRKYDKEIAKNLFRKMYEKCKRKKSVLNNG